VAIIRILTSFEEKKASEVAFSLVLRSQTYLGVLMA
jgi:hypothetical protein